MQNQPAADQSPVSFIHELLARLDINIEHSSAAKAEAAAWHGKSGFNDPDLTDWTALPFVTIDNADSLDLDQALLITNTESGYRIRYALADAAFYIRPGSTIFEEALVRGTTFYTPLLSAPMLPRSLSEGLLSLNPNVDRRALVFDMYLDAYANIQKTIIVRALVHSQAKLCYTGVQAFLNSENTALDNQPFSESLRLLQSVGNKLIAKGLERGVAPFDRTETQITVTSDPAAGEHFIVQVRERLDTERYNEQLSLLCNMEGAALLQALKAHDIGLQPVFRTHPAPLKEQRRQLEETLKELVEAKQLEEMWLLNPGQTLADYFSKLPRSPAHRQLLRAIQRQILQSQRASIFQAKPDRHHALAAASYARFSSPMREVAGIYTHKELLDALGVAGMETYTSDILTTGVTHYPKVLSIDEDASRLQLAVIDSANRARQLQKQIEKAIEFTVISRLLHRDLQQSPRPFRSGALMGIRKDKLYIGIDDLALDIKVYRVDLEAHYGCEYEFGNALITPVSVQTGTADAPKAPTLALGDAVTLVTNRWNAERQRFIMDIHKR
ncbi:MAG: ribonuclease catalytic domain-containing protein [Granulosicoccus sp.]